MNKNKSLKTLCLAGALALTSVSGTALSQQFISIGTGGVTGVYYPVGGAICRLVNAGRADHGIRCGVESTGGSVFNVNTIRAGELDFGISQSDVQYNAYEGKAAFEGNAYKDLRSVFALHTEAFTVVASAGANVTHFDQLAGKRVNVGNPGSGSRAMYEALLNNQGKDFGIYSQAADLVPAQMSAALCDNQLDAITYVVGQPNGAIQEATSACRGRLVNVDGPAVDQLLAQFPYYSTTTIPGGMYTGNPNDVNTFGVAATLVTSANVPDDVVYELVKSVFSNLDSFKNLHPALSILTAQEMTSQGLSAPLHPGAARYYREIGLLN